MTQIPSISIPKWSISLLNNVYELESKLVTHGDPGNGLRNVEKIRDLLREEGLTYENPLGQVFKETRTDLDASISGEGIENLRVVEVIKPIVRVSFEGFSRVVQKGIVLVQSDNDEGSSS